MNGYYIYPTYPPMPVYPTFQTIPPKRLTYPQVDTKVFEESVKSFHFLFTQGELLLDRLGDSGFAHKVMDAAQQGKKAKVDDLVKSVGLQVPFSATYTPSGIIFTLATKASQQSPFGCCSLTISMKWGS